MASISELTTAPALDISTMSRVQKLAALLIILGPESAAQILKSLSAEDLDVVSAEMAKLPVITEKLRLEVLREMSEIAMVATTSLRGGMEFTQAALEKAVGSYKATAIMSRVSANPGSADLLQRLDQMEPRHIFNLIKEEHLQTITLIASHLRPAKASEVLALLRPELRDQVIERLATLEPSPMEVIETVVDVMQRRLQGKTSRGLNQSGGLKSAADVLNALQKNVSKSIITSLEERNAELGQAIRQKMFIFTDLTRLDAPALQTIMREIDTRDLALALKKSDEAVKTKLLSGISKRAAETVNEEITFLGAVKLKEIDAAQLRIIEVVRRLEGEGEIDLEIPQEAAA